MTTLKLSSPQSNEMPQLVATQSIGKLKRQAKSSFFLENLFESNNKQNTIQNISKNVSSSQNRIKLKKLMDEVVMMQNEYLSKTQEVETYTPSLKIQSVERNLPRLDSPESNTISKQTDFVLKKTLSSILNQSGSEKLQSKVENFAESVPFISEPEKFDNKKFYILNECEHNSTDLITQTKPIEIYNDESLDLNEMRVDEISLKKNPSFSLKKNKSADTMSNMNSSNVVKKTTSEPLLEHNSFKSVKGNSKFKYLIKNFNTNLNTAVKKLEEIVDLIDNSNSKCYETIMSKKIQPNSNEEYKTLQSTQSKNEKIFINRLNKKEHFLSHTINRNMELLQKCIQTNRESTDCYLNEMASSNATDSSKITITPTKKKLNFYSLGTQSNVSSLYRNSNLNLAEEILKCQNENENETEIFDKIDELFDSDELEECDQNGTDLIGDKYVCKTCGIRTKNPSKLLKHMKSHENIRPFICCYCNVSFKTKGNLVKHMKSRAHLLKCNEAKLNFSNVSEPSTTTENKNTKKTTFN